MPGSRGAECLVTSITWQSPFVTCGSQFWQNYSVILALTVQDTTLDKNGLSYINLKLSLTALTSSSILLNYHSIQRWIYETYKYFHIVSSSEITKMIFAKIKTDDSLLYKWKKLNFKKDQSIFLLGIIVFSKYFYSNNTNCYKKLHQLLATKTCIMALRLNGHGRLQ